MLRVTDDRQHLIALASFLDGRQNARQLVSGHIRTHVL
ncbi:hypothetical protein ALO68_101275 [Pseudomonas syringae pv. helianthi]|uniref:Uncharacterized protein n=3 Tax=Pseudomonas syringae group TaxID=136849 RepID=A0A0P9PAR7_9PSED|nr:hypothetical protein ALO80_101245 [Pseudomonas caricapapayae]KPX49300.1 hypothetical protein ALO68_101275 [Pseudomonas syringae pv. helianthi]KPY83846.1 hypothetical protein ALO44_101168 [Pseudomonas syringae pv. tagetis]RMM07512.1 hypothetical protein ALQ84_101100 [Pseudomonas caricapapayae]RMV52049.1 hypothetical protein ALP10_101032 [Pseudomonas syringae pv. helianthi]